MPFYILTGRNPAGVPVAEWIEAESGAAAAAAFRRQGFTDVVLQTDDIEALGYQRGSPAVQLPAATLLQMRNGASFRPPLWRVVLASYFELRYVALIIIAVFLYRRWKSQVWTWWDYVLVGLLLTPLVLEWAARWFSKSDPYKVLLEHATWGRWQTVLNLLTGLRPLLNNESECAFREAQALAGLGRLDDALATVAPFGDGARMPLFLYYGRLAEVYNAGQQRDTAVQCLERAAELAPQLPSTQLDLAAAILRVRPDVPRARALLDQVRAQELTPFLKTFLGHCDGLIALHEGRPHDAVRLLKRFLEELPTCGMVTPPLNVIADLNRGFLALALSRAGDRRAAFEMFSTAEPRLAALKCDYILTPCREELRLPG